MITRALMLLTIILAISIGNARADTITVRVVQVPASEIHRYCSAGVGCYHPATNTVYIREIRGFADRERLLDLGHEIYHAMGHRHE